MAIGVAFVAFRAPELAQAYALLAVSCGAPGAQVTRRIARGERSATRLAMRCITARRWLVSTRKPVLIVTRLKVCRTSTSSVHRRAFTRLDWLTQRKNGTLPVPLPRRSARTAQLVRSVISAASLS